MIYATFDLVWANSTDMFVNGASIFSRYCKTVFFSSRPFELKYFRFVSTFAELRLLLFFFVISSEFVTFCFCLLWSLCARNLAFCKHIQLFTNRIQSTEIYFFFKDYSFYVQLLCNIPNSAFYKLNSSFFKSNPAF